MLQRYILEHGWQGLKDNLGIQVKEYDNYHVLNYSQVDSPKAHPVVMDCRGTIINKNTLEIVCSPFKRFFNFGENGCPKDINFSKCVIVEKVDGSLCKIWWDDIASCWQIGTRGTAFGENYVNGTGITFRELFLRAAKVNEEEFQEWANNHLFIGTTYMFELCCAENRVVTAYPEDTLVFLGSRKWGGLPGYQHIPNVETLKGINSRPTINFRLESMDEIQSSIDAMEGLQEGFVVLDGNYTPICKIKSPKYVKAHRIKSGGLTQQRIVDIIWDNEQEEYLTYFPEDEKYFLPWTNALCSLVDHVAVLQQQTKDVESQKEYAMIVKNLPIAGIMFNIRKGLTISEALEKVSVSSRVNIIKDYLEND